MESNYVKGKQGMVITRRVQANVRIVVAMMAVFAVAVGLLFSSHAVFAADNNAANTLKVTPVRSDIEIEPGASKTVPTTVTNLTKAPITVRPIENDFVAGDERGTPALILDADKYAPTHSLKRFMAPLADVTIPAGKSVTINVVITVPKGTQAGGYFGAVRFAPTSPDDGGQVNLSASVASLILLTVPGDTVEKLELTDFSVQQGGVTGTMFSSSNDLQTTVRFQNSGNVQIAPFGKVSVKQGDKVVYAADFNTTTPRDTILPDSARRWDIPLKNIDSFGQYTVVGTFTYGKKNQTIEVSKSFWVIPQSVIIAAVLGVIVLIGLIVALILYLRSRKRRNNSRSSNGNMRL